ncbi:MAG: hypothetical protein JWP44_2072, partial [Mucilaginibacter sp.]|nr:hypothetical protein [Mucilaginibacter sp.]
MTHIVNSVQLEVTCPDEDMSFNLRQNFAQTFQLQIAEIIDTVCSAYVSENESIKIDKLELDLGSFSRHTFDTEFRKVLDIKLQQELADKLSKIAPAKRQVSRQVSNTEILLYFLTNGTLPWFADETTIDIDEICQDVFLNQANTFGSFFYSHRFKTNIWKRVLWQLNDRSKELVIGLSADIQKAKEVFINWVAKLSEKIPGLKSDELQMVFSKINDLLIENASAIYSGFNNDKVLAQIFKAHIDAILNKDRKLRAEANLEFINIVHTVPLNQETAIEVRQENKTYSVKEIFAEAETENAVEKYNVKNAGVVLLAPFLRSFFKELNLLDGDGWKNPESAHRAVHLLKFLSHGQTTMPEYSLVFEKILCSLPVDEPVPLHIVLEETEMEEGLSLLKAVITHWRALKNTSVE